MAAMGRDVSLHARRGRRCVVSRRPRSGDDCAIGPRRQVEVPPLPDLVVVILLRSPTCAVGAGPAAAAAQPTGSVVGVFVDYETRACDLCGNAAAGVFLYLSTRSGGFFDVNPWHLGAFFSIMGWIAWHGSSSVHLGWIADSFRGEDLARTLIETSICPCPPPRPSLSLCLLPFI